MSVVRRRCTSGWIGLSPFALIALLNSLSAQAQLAPVAGAHYAGRPSDTGFAGAVNSQGSYGASVPLDLPAARDGLPIPLQITYGGRRVGAAGLGWDVPLSYIFRDTTTARRRPGHQQLSLMLNGQSFVLVRNAGDTAWVAQRGNAQLEVRADRDVLVMYDGEGRTYTFSPQGGSAGSRLVGGNLYMLVAIQTAGGNSVTLSYKFEAPVLPGGDTGLAINLLTVRYNASPTTPKCVKNTVHLVYDVAARPPEGEPPPAVLSMTTLGDTVLARVAKLTKVVVASQPSCTEAEVALRTYAFNYKPDVDTAQPRLESVVKQGRRGTPEQNVVLPVASYAYGSIVDPETRQITYQETANTGPPFVIGASHYLFGVSYTYGITSPEPHSPSDTLIDLFTGQSFIDLNGDGRPDFVGEGGRYQSDPGPNGTNVILKPLVLPISSSEKIHSSVLGTRLPYRINPVINDTLKQLIDMNGDGRLDVVETVLPDTNTWLVHLNTPDPSDPKKSVIVDISLPVTRMRAALGTTGLSFGRVPLGRKTTVPESFAAGNTRKRTITEFELKDINGDGYPDFVYNATHVRTADATRTLPGEMTGSRDVKMLINTAGVHLANGVDLFASQPITLESAPTTGCGIDRWEADPASESGGLLNEVCGFEDVNGDGILDRVNSVVENGQVVSKAALGTGVTTRPYATGALIALPGPLGRTEIPMVTIGVGVYAPANCSTPAVPTFQLRRTRSLRDINGDGIADYISGQILERGPGIWNVALGTGTGYTAPIAVDSFLGLEPSREESICGATTEGSEVSATPSGIYDIDGDGQPEIINLNLASPGNPHWEILQLKPPANQTDLGPVASVPAAGRLIKIDNGYGAITRISYKSAKEDAQTRHQLPYPEIVVAAVSTTNNSGTPLLSTTRYAYGGSELIFDSARDAFVFPGYQRTVQMQAANIANVNEGLASITDRYSLSSNTAESTSPDPVVRLKRYLKTGHISDVTTLSGFIGNDPFGLLNANINNDSRRIAGVHYDWEARLLAPGPAMSGNESCLDMMFPYDFASSNANALSDDQCTKRGFLFQTRVDTWRGSPGTGSGFSGPNTVRTRSEVQTVDNFGRILTEAQWNDQLTTSDDLCIQNVYAVPVGTKARKLSALASQTVTNCAMPPATTPAGGWVVYAKDTWEFDKQDAVPAGGVSTGFVTSHTVSRLNSDTNVSLGDIRLFDATYDISGNPTSVKRTREDGATRTVSTTYDTFGIASTSVKTEGTNANGSALPALLTTIDRDPLTLDALGTTDPNGSQIGNTFDGFGRVLLSTVTPTGGATGALSSMTYQGFALDDTGGRKIVQKVFTDPVSPGAVGTAAGRSGTLYLDSLGREIKTEIALGADYANQVLVAASNTYDSLGRVQFEADSYLLGQTNSYGTTRLYNTDGTPSCFIRGFGLQAHSEVTNEAIERYPTCFTRYFENTKEVVRVRDPAALVAVSPRQKGLTETFFTAIGVPLATNTYAGNTAGGRGGALDRTSFLHDVFGRLTKLIRYQDPIPLSSTEPTSGSNPVTTTWHFDSLGQVIGLDEPASAPQSRTYDNWGELTQVQWNDATSGSSTDRRTITEYDAFGRITHTEERSNNVVDVESKNDYAYDRPVNNATPSVMPTNVLGRLARASSPTSTVSFGYDDLGRLNTQVFSDTTTSPATVYVQKQSAHGDNSLATLELLLPDNGFKSERVDYSYDSAGRTRAASYTDGTITQSLFSAAGGSAIDAFGRIRQAQYGAATFTASYADAGRRLINGFKVTSPAGTSREITFPAPAGLNSSFDALGRERMRREVVNGDANAPTFETSYDTLGRVKTSSRNPVSASVPNMSLSYDALGNVAALAAATGTSSASLNYQNVDRDRICSVAYGSGTPSTTCNVQYDGAGNIVEQPSRANGVRRLTYLANGLIKRVTDGNGNDAKFRYDAFGDLQLLTLTSNTSSDTRLDRHFGSLISQREEIVGGVKKSVIVRSIPGPGVVATRHGAGASDPWTFAFGESRGNRFFTNQAGAFVQDLDYQVYGESKSTGAQPGAPSYSREQWNGRDVLAALGLSRLGARLYDPVIGRFLSRDPLINPRSAASANPYAFANNDPVNGSDPSGLFTANEGEEKPSDDDSCFICGDLDGWKDALDDVGDALGDVGDAIGDAAGSVADFFGFGGGGSSAPPPNTSTTGAPGPASVNFFGVPISGPLVLHGGTGVHDSIGNLASDCDGAVDCYGPPNKPGQDYLQNAHVNGDLSQPFSGAVRTDNAGNPILNSSGYYVSQSSFGMDANNEYYVAGNARTMHGQPLGTIVRVEDTQTGNVRYAMYGDGGGSNKLPNGTRASGPHEGSTRLVNELAGQRISPRGGPGIQPVDQPTRFHFRIYNDSNTRRLTPDEVQSRGALLEKFGWYLDYK